MMSHLSCRVGMGGIWELLDGKIWEWDLSFKREWEWDGNGNEVIEMGGNWYEKSVPAHLYYILDGFSPRDAMLARYNVTTLCPSASVRMCPSVTSL